MNLGGGTHHAGPRLRPRLLPVQRRRGDAGAAARRKGWSQRAVVVDCDVHQGDGTAQILGPDPDAFTLSLHGARNYPFERIPSDLDVDLPTRHRRRRVPRRADGALDVALDGDYDVAFYLAGADPWEGDRLGRLALTKAGLRARDELVLDRLLARRRRRSSCSPAATRRTSRTPSTSTPRRSTPSPRATSP